MGNDRKARASEMARRGGGCERCGYSRCVRALQFHHVDPTHKQEYGKGRVRLAELLTHPERFLLLCANCHFEEHEEQDQAVKNRIPCETCGTLFVSPRYLAKHDRGRFCSKPCLHTAMKRKGAAQSTLIPRFWKYAVQGEGDACWGWKGSWTGSATRPQRYAMLPAKATDGSGRTIAVMAARVSFELHRGPVPAGTQITRTCENPGCVNPNHLALRKAS